MILVMNNIYIQISKRCLKSIFWRSYMMIGLFGFISYIIMNDAIDSQSYFGRILREFNRFQCITLLLEMYIEAPLPDQVSTLVHIFSGLSIRAQNRTLLSNTIRCNKHSRLIVFYGFKKIFTLKTYF